MSALLTEIDSVAVLDEAGWERRLPAYPGATLFHAPPWARAVRQAYGSTIHPVEVSTDRGRALIPLTGIRSPLTGSRGVSIAFSDACAPLIEGDLSVSDLCLSLAPFARAQGWRYFELRDVPAMPGVAPAAEFFGHSINLAQSPDEVFSGFHSSLQRSIRKGRRLGVEVTIADSPSALADYFALHLRTRQRHGVPPQPWRFFRAIGTEVIAAGHGFIVTARHEGRAFASAVFLVWGAAAIYKFGASDERQNVLRGNHLVIWEGLQEAMRRGATRLHLGRTDLHHAGLRQFKLSWGAAEFPLRYYRFCADASGTPMERSRRSAAGSPLKHLPRAAQRLAGNLLYPHLD